MFQNDLLSLSNVIIVLLYSICSRFMKIYALIINIEQIYDLRNILLMMKLL